ncbi:MAG: TonB-dependent receptor domain-containing protein, partial [Myxococcota bacterium]
NDFEQTPYRRYRATSLDLMQWHRTQVVARYGFEMPGFDLQVVAYRHDLERAWRKLNRFRGGPSLDRLLSNPASAQSSVYMGVLRGQDSGTPEEALLVGTNDRRFYSQGGEARASIDMTTGVVSHQIEAGARLHADAIDRLHTEDAYRMQAGTLVPEGTATSVLIDGTASALAAAVYVADEIQWGQLLVSPGLRLELIRTAVAGADGDESSHAWQGAWLPGLGISWQPVSFLALLGGVHKGFSPVSPGQSSEVEPEEAWSFEGGARLFHEDTDAEVVGFASVKTPNCMNSSMEVRLSSMGSRQWHAIRRDSSISNGIFKLPIR